MKKSKLRTIIKEELRRLNEDAKTEVGDGKLPNKYFVTQSTDFLIS